VDTKTMDESNTRKGEKKEKTREQNKPTYKLEK
jgi:hypothetical protein